MTRHVQIPISTNQHLLALLDQFPTNCDPEFDNDYEELERQFAELRLTLNNN